MGTAAQMGLRQDTILICDAMYAFPESLAFLAAHLVAGGEPMAVAELVFWAQRQRSAAMKWAVASLMVLGCLVTFGGIAAIGFVSWVPTITG